MELDNAECKSQPGCCVDDVEAQRNTSNVTEDEQEPKGIKGLGWLDRLLALWILLAMIIGILLGNFVDNVGPALHKGEFVGVSIPIGESLNNYQHSLRESETNTLHSYWTVGHDVPDSLQGEVRVATPCVCIEGAVDPSWI